MPTKKELLERLDWILSALGKFDDDHREEQEQTFESAGEQFLADLYGEEHRHFQAFRTPNIEKQRGVMVAVRKEIEAGWVKPRARRRGRAR